MFSSYSRIQQRKGKYGTERHQYFKDLLAEYKSHKTPEAQEEIVSHLGNFAYDPINYQDILALGVVDLFLDALDTPDIKYSKVKSLALAGLVNCCLDPRIAQSIYENGALKSICTYLESENPNDILNSLSLYLFMAQACEASRRDIFTEDIITKINVLLHSDNINIKNTATIFLYDVYAVLYYQDVEGD